MDVRLLASLNEAESFVTSLAFPPAHFSRGNSLISSGGSGIFALAASEDDHLRLYDLDFPIPINNSNNNNSGNSALSMMAPSFLAADYHLSATGCDKVAFTQGNTHCLIAPRLRRDHQIYCMNLETGSVIASYICNVHQNYQDPQVPPQSSSGNNNNNNNNLSLHLPWFGSLVVHPKAPGVFATQGEGSVVNFFSASVSAPVARLSTPSRGRATIAFSPISGNYFAVGDAEAIAVYDWRRLGVNCSTSNNNNNTSSNHNSSSHNASNNPMVQQINLKQGRAAMHAARWLQDVGSVSGLDFHPVHDHQQLLVTTSRYIVRTLDVQQGEAIHSYGASGAAASHLPNERPQALANKRCIATAAKFSPDGRYVAVGSCLRRVCVFETPSDTATADQQQHHFDQNSSSSSSMDQDVAATTSSDKAPVVPAVLSHVLHGQHGAAVSCAEWCPNVPVLVSTCKTGNVWRFCAGR